MRITINYFEGYPELEAELSKYPLRARAERVRNLASIGLSMLQQAQMANHLQTHSHAGEKQVNANVGHRVDVSEFGEVEQGHQQPEQATPKKPASSAVLKNLFGQV